MYVKVTGSAAVEYTMAQLRADNHKTSFPADPSDEVLARYDVYPAIETAPPAYDASYQQLTYDFTGSGSTWTQNWSVVGNGISDDDLREVRYQENNTYADLLAGQAAMTPEQGVVLTERQVLKQDARRNNIGRWNKDLKVSDADDYLFDWLDTLADALDQADDAVEVLDRAALEAWVPTNSPFWPTWTPYAP